VSWPPEERDLVVRIDLSKGGTFFISFECQLGAHWGCPAPHMCRCTDKDCPCNQTPKASPGATASTAPPTPEADRQ
jgi:hypothetical protein